MFKTPEDSRDFDESDLISFFQTLKDECTLAICFIFTNSNCKEVNYYNTACKEEMDQTRFLIYLLKSNDNENYDVHIISKSLALLANNHTDSWNETRLIYHDDVLDSIKKIIGYGQMSTTREATRLLAKIISNPDGMLLWLKFSSKCLTINSACSEDNLVTWGNPYHLPDNRGLYRNWGAFFDYGDVLEIPGGL
jgi:hypothetical protein